MTLSYVMQAASCSALAKKMHPSGSRLMSKAPYMISLKIIVPLVYLGPVEQETYLAPAPQAIAQDG